MGACVGRYSVSVVPEEQGYSEPQLAHEVQVFEEPEPEPVVYDEAWSWSLGSSWTLASDSSDSTLS